MRKILLNLDFKKKLCYRWLRSFRKGDSKVIDENSAMVINLDLIDKKSQLKKNLKNYFFRN